MTPDRTTLAATFDQVADLYDRARPDYPVAIIDLLQRCAGLRPGQEVLEIGSGTGKATRLLRARGLRVTCLEPGPALADVSRRTFADDPGVRVVTTSLEDWQPPGDPRFAGVVAATSWHWLDPETRYRRVWELLRPGGHLAFWSASHVWPADGDPIFGELAEVYAAIGEPGEPPPAPHDLPDQAAEIVASRLFSPALVRRLVWETTYDATAYIDLLRTFSGHILMTDAQREHLFGAIRDKLAARPDGQLRRHWGAVLHVAQRLEQPPPE